MKLGKMLQPVPSLETDIQVSYLRAGGLNWNGVTADELPRMWANPREVVEYEVRSGDLVVAEGGDAGRATILPETPSGTIIQNSLHRVRGEPVELRFLYYVLRAIHASGWLEAACNKSTIGHLTGEKLKSLPVPAPGPLVQGDIVSYLDRETARIDAIVRGRFQVRELLDHRLWSGFAKRLAELAPRSFPLRRVLTGLTDGPFGSAFSSEEYSADGASVVRLGNIGFGEYRSADQVFISLDLYASFLRYRVLEGDLLIAGLGDDRNHPGRACTAPNLGPAIVKGKCFCARVNEDRASARYLAWFLSSPQGAQAISAVARGSTRSMINLEIVKDVHVPLPRVSEQEGLAAWMDDRRLQYRHAAAAMQSHINLLEERRESLITAAVTGQIRVAGTAA